MNSMHPLNSAQRKLASTFTDIVPQLAAIVIAAITFGSRLIFNRESASLKRHVSPQIRKVA